MSDDLKLLVEWSDPWQEFVSSIRPALGRSPLPLAGEAPTGLMPYRGMLVSWALEATLLAAVIILPMKLAGLRPYSPPHLPKYDVIYFSADELPQTQDAGGAQSGRSGRGGGQEARHRTQTIRVVRGNTVVEKVVDAPDINLPVSSDAVKNLLALKHDPGPPPAEGLRSAVSVPSIREGIVAPPPQLLAELDRRAPSLGERVIAPPPDSAEDKNRALAPMSATVVEPPPSSLSSRTRTMPTVNAGVIAPPPSDVTDPNSRAIIGMKAPVVKPAPNDPERELPTLRAPASGRIDVVPPPVSAPQRPEAQTPKLALPAPAVVAPPPSQVSPGAHRLSGVALGDPEKVVPPPVQMSNTPEKPMPGMLGTANVVPPPPSLAGRTSVGSEQGIGRMATAGKVVPPPPSVAGGMNTSGGGTQRRGPVAGLASGPVVPPPPSVASGNVPQGGGSHAGGLPGGSVGGVSVVPVVPPPPSMAGMNGFVTGHGSGSKGNGLGGLSDTGAVLAPPNSEGTGSGKGIIVSANPGNTEGAPKNGGAGTIAMSPAGGDRSGLGGSGGGGGIVHGAGPGSGLTGEGPGGGKEGMGRGSNPEARGGISPYPGPGGSGSGTSAQPAVPGVSVQGGNTVTLPSFGSGETEPSIPGRSGSGKGHGNFGVTIEGSSRAGGAFARYGQLPGNNITLPFLPTAAGPAVMQYSDPSSVSHPYSGRITDPVPIRLDVPRGLPHTRMVFACDLDREGVLRNIRVLESERPAVTTKVLAALPSWKFVPAMLGDQPIEVRAFLGFNIDTR